MERLTTSVGIVTLSSGCVNVPRKSQDSEIVKLFATNVAREERLSYRHSGLIPSHSLLYLDLVVMLDVSAS